MPCRPPVTTRKCSSPSRRIVRSERKPPPGREQRRVDGTPDRHVHLAHRDLLHGRERARAGDVEDAERAEVEDRRAVAHREVLGVDDRRPPARVPLGRAAVDAVLVDELGVRLVPVRALPAGGLEEHRAERLLAGVERRQPDVAVRRPLLAGMDDPVGLVEALGGPRADVRGRLLAVVEARDVRRLEVDLRLAVRHPLRDRPADARPLLDPHGGRRPQALDLRRLAEQRQPVRRQRQQAVDRVLDADALVADDLRHQLERVLHLEREVVLGERELGRRQRRLLDRGDLARVVEDRAVGVRADLEAGAVLALVHVRVHVAHDRELDRPASRRRTAAPGRCRSSGGSPASAGSRRRPCARPAGSRRRSRSRPSRPRRRRRWSGRGGRARARCRSRSPRRSATTVSAPEACASSRISVPARSESTTPTPSE